MNKIKSNLPCISKIRTKNKNFMKLIIIKKQKVILYASIFPTNIIRRTFCTSTCITTKKIIFVFLIPITYNNMIQRMNFYLKKNLLTYFHYRFVSNMIYMTYWKHWIHNLVHIFVEEHPYKVVIQLKQISKE
jgi:hypothetical protein